MSMHHISQIISITQNKVMIKSIQNETRVFSRVGITICHILLGRPWLYDREVVVNGIENTYSIIKDGEKYILDIL